MPDRSNRFPYFPLPIMADHDVQTDLARYARQMSFQPLGWQGQRRLAGSRALLCGCGALGSAVANLLVRAGVGTLRIVDRDFVDLGNLHRQTLFDETDVATGLPKAIAAAGHLRRINCSAAIEPVVADIDAENILPLCDGIDLILDGTDNFETRFLINDAAVKLGLPWIYAGCLGAQGQTMTIIPGQTACLRCLIPDCPAPGSLPTCDMAGIIGPAVGLIAALEAAEALKILSGHPEAISHDLIVCDLWNNSFKRLDISRLHNQTNCITCKQGRFEWLAGQMGSRTETLCGRNAVQLSSPGVHISLDELAARLRNVGQLTCNEFLLRLKVEGCEITVFRDARAIISGTDDIPTARAIYAKYIGV